MRFVSPFVAFSPLLFFADSIPAEQLHRLTPPGPSMHRQFGLYVNVDGDKAIVGAPIGGSAYVFDTKSGEQLFEVDEIYATSVAIESSTVAIVGDHEICCDDGPGAAYLYSAIDGAFVRKLAAVDADPNDMFGFSVAIESDRGIVGAPGDDELKERAGAAYLFNLDTGEQMMKFMSAEGVGIGRSVDISGGTVIVGSIDSAHIFDADSGDERFRLTAQSESPVIGFGRSVGIDGNLAIVGAPARETGTLPGSAYIFDVSTGEQLHRLQPNDPVAANRFGIEVDIFGRMAIVGATFAHHDGLATGAAYVFDVATGEQLLKLTPTEIEKGDEFGYVAIDGTIAVIGAPADEINEVISAGSVYVFQVPEPGSCIFFGFGTMALILTRLIRPF